jgi:hypothetical protein
METYLAAAALMLVIALLALGFYAELVELVARLRSAGLLGNTLAPARLAR